MSFVWIALQKKEDNPSTNSSMTNLPQNLPPPDNSICPTNLSQPGHIVLVTEEM
jgi:hypothetical protein